MPSVFMEKSSWLIFAEEHNATANFNAAQLNGSESYTLAAIHLAAGVPLPKSILLDTKRAQGKFVADHFNGLKELYESGIESRKWLPNILEQSRQFARVHSLDSDQMIVRMIRMTEIKGRRTVINRPVQLKTAFVEVCDRAEITQNAAISGSDDEYDIKI